MNDHTWSIVGLSRNPERIPGKAVLRRGGIAATVRDTVGLASVLLLAVGISPAKAQAVHSPPLPAALRANAGPHMVGGPRQQAFIFDIYDAFQRGEFDRWDSLFARDVVTNSSGQFGVKGLAAVKEWAKQFVTAFAARIDLVDWIDAIDQNGNGRAVITFNLNWHHVKPFFNVQPTGRSGTSIENLILTVRDWKVQRMEVADTTLDMGLYLHARGWAFPQNVHPKPVIKGIERDKINEIPLHE
jgi:hypothetical protein